MIDNKIAGIDDAGRGAIIGPLVIAGILVSEKESSILSKLGVKDSKSLSPMARSKLYKEIIKNVNKVIVKKIPTNKIDIYVSKGEKYRKLNFLEAITMSSVINELNPSITYVDSPDVNVDRFGSQIASSLNVDSEIVSSHHADQLYISVSAASIVAKYVRDLEISKLIKKHGDFGSGYPSDQKTIDFLSDWLVAKGKIPRFARSSWKTWQRLLNTTLD